MKAVHIVVCVTQKRLKPDKLLWFLKLTQIVSTVMLFVSLWLLMWLENRFQNKPLAMISRKAFPVTIRPKM